MYLAHSVLKIATFMTDTTVVAICLRVWPIEPTDMDGWIRLDLRATVVC